MHPTKTLHRGPKAELFTQLACGCVPLNASTLTSPLPAVSLTPPSQTCCSNLNVCRGASQMLKINIQNNKVIMLHLPRESNADSWLHALTLTSGVILSEVCSEDPAGSDHSSV